MKKLLFFIPDLRYGGAEKVLVNLLNNLDRNKYDISLLTLFDEGTNKQYLKSHIKYSYIFKRIFRGNSHFLKLFTPKFLYKWFVKDQYDILIAYLEGIPTRVFSGCTNKGTKKVCWVHIEMLDPKYFMGSYRTYNEGIDCYKKYNAIVAVSETVKETFERGTGLTNVQVKYNTVETETILNKSMEKVGDTAINKDIINVCSVGKLVHTKGYDRLLRIHKRLINEGIKYHLYILGQGECRSEFEGYIKENNLQDSVTLVGFRENPYKYVRNCNLFVCSSLKEGYSTSVTEALIVGTPVLTTLCSGMKEMLGDNEFGIIVPNNEEALYEGMKDILNNKEKLAHYKQKAIERGDFFSTERTVKEVEDLFDNT